MANESTSAQIGQAWRSHREGSNDTAIDQFGRILRSTPDSIDANYGLGLANKALGNKSGAVEAFQRALDLTGKVEPTGEEERARYMMLARMVSQRLEEVQGAQ